MLKIFLKIAVVFIVVYALIFALYKIISYPFDIFNKEERVELINDLYLEEVDGHLDISKSEGDGIYRVIFDEQIDSIAITKNYLIIRSEDKYCFISIDKAKIERTLNKYSFSYVVRNNYTSILFNSPKEIFEKNNN